MTDGPDASAHGESADEPDRATPARPSRPARSGTLRFLLLESAVVIISVLVALAVDGWREGVRETERADRARQEVLAETEVNLEELLLSDSIISTRMARLRGLEEELAAADEPFELASFGGFWAPDLRRAAWERVSRSELAGELPPQFLDGAFRLYQVNEDLASLDEEIRELVFGPVSHRAEQAPVAWSMAMAVLRQQLAWIELSVGLHRDFLERFAPSDGG